MLLPGVLAPPAPSTPASVSGAVANGSIGGSAPYHSADGILGSGVLWTPGNTDGMNGGNPASYNDGSGSSANIPYAVYRARGWRLQARLSGNVTLATGGGRASGVACQFLSNGSYVSARYEASLNPNGSPSFTGNWIDVLPSSSFASITVTWQVCRYSPVNSSSDNITWSAATVDFQWVNP